MVPQTLRTGRSRGRRLAVAALGALSLSLGACRRGGDTGGTDTGTAAGRAVADVRGRYTANDAIASGAWAWSGADGAEWVAVDLQSAVQGLVQARLDLWKSDASGTVRVGRSDVMPAAAEFTAYAFEDLTRDGLPDFFGAVADSTGEAYPVFIPGAVGAMGDELELASHGWRFAASEDDPPQLVRGPSGPCALQLWAEATPDSSPPGWRWLALGTHGALGAPAAAAPVCP